ncbi:hypothetical protein NP233_g6520 [Leucocoprinus birnbaumii]|uniref:Uncharacterized protein n=1 Tax=Leucocoprinus birnbaumii TaxID=56174 RepID=A0AAD5VQV5_9AGAR|nr:hypothetical protein NP233_g6520 [Leucocoprinus birnbaumii]
MLLLLSSLNPVNSSYATETGQVLYKVNKTITGPATIRKAVGTVQGVWRGDTGGFEIPGRKESRTDAAVREVNEQTDGWST